MTSNTNNLIKCSVCSINEISNNFTKCYACATNEYPHNFTNCPVCASGGITISCDFRIKCYCFLNAITKSYDDAKKGYTKRYVLNCMEECDCGLFYHTHDLEKIGYYYDEETFKVLPLKN